MENDKAIVGDAGVPGRTYSERLLVTDEWCCSWIEGAEFDPDWDPDPDPPARRSRPPPDTSMNEIK